MSYSLPDLPYDYGALEPVYDGHVLELHHGKHHAAYVTALNKTLERLADARAGADFRAIVGLEKTLAFNLSGHVLHSLFWRNLEPNESTPASGQLESRIQAAFGSVDAFRRQFGAAGSALQGSGWVALTYDPLHDTLLVEQFHDHEDRSAPGTLPAARRRHALDPRRPHSETIGRRALRGPEWARVLSPPRASSAPTQSPRDAAAPERLFPPRKTPVPSRRKR